MPLYTTSDSFLASVQDEGPDYIIVGGGTAGLVLASRLSEDSSVSVAVLESGPAAMEEERINLPGLYGSLIGSELDYKLMTTPSDDGVPAAFWPRGHVLGGCTAINYQMWDRASSVEYDGWAELGNTGWDSATLMHYMKKAETYHAPSDATVRSLGIVAPDSRDMGSGGPIHLAFSPTIGFMSPGWISGLEEIGVPRNDRPLSGNNIGAAMHPSSIRHTEKGWKRSYAASSYLESSLARSNLHVLTGATVDRLKFESDGTGQQRAVSVLFRQGDHPQHKSAMELRVKREVILCAGTIFSPAILERSGIGSRGVLEKAGVPVLIDLPGVGENVQDHTYSGIILEMRPDATTGKALESPAGLMGGDEAFKKQAREMYEKDDTQQPGWLATAPPAVSFLTLQQASGASAVAHERVKEAEEYAASVPPGAAHAYTLKKQMEWLTCRTNEVAQSEVIALDVNVNPFFTEADGSKSYMTIFTIPQHPLSRGSIHISSADASSSAAPMRIASGYHGCAFDTNIHLSGIRFARALSRTRGYAELVACEVGPLAGLEGEEELRAAIRDTPGGTFTMNHQAASCSMLPRAHGGVVDPNLVVYGTRNVRVCDASVFPVHVAAHPQATVYGVAEAAADMIKRQRATGMDNEMGPSIPTSS